MIPSGSRLSHHFATHCVKSVQIRSFSGRHFPVFSPNAGKYGPEKTLYFDTFHIVTIPIGMSKMVIPC